MNKIALIISFTLLSYLSFGQLHKYNIGQYTPPELRYHQLQLQFRLSGDKQKNHPSIGDNSRLFSDLFANYYQYRRTPKYQGSLDYKIDFSYNENKVESTPNNPVQGRITTSNNKKSSIRLNNQFFIWPKKFIELNLTSKVNFKENHSEAPNQTAQKKTY